MTSDQTAAGRPVFRFAPSPNGFLHLGHALSALLNHDMARRTGGRFLLRIEDIDLQRSKPEFVAAIFEDLAWLGLEWEEPVMRQSERFSAYALALEELAMRGLTYPCFCSRGEIADHAGGQADWPIDPDGQPVYPGTCRALSPDERNRRLASGLRAAQRLNMQEALAAVAGRIGWHEFSLDGGSRSVTAEPSLWGDAVIARKDVPASYHLAVVIDDAAQGVTDVVRGQDLFNATSLHRLLQDLLGLPPPAYHHHALLLDAEGRKLAKSLRSTALRNLRADGVSADEIRRLVGLA